MRTESADYREGFAAGRDDARAQMDALYDQNYQLESELNQLRARAQRIEAALVMTEDQRDKGFAERDALISAAMDTVHKGIAAYNTAVAERDEAQHELNDLESGMRQWENEYASAVASVIAERDELRKQLEDIKRDYVDTSYWGKE